MGSMVQQYMPGGRSISTTTGPAAPAGGADDGLMEMFREAARRKLQPAPPQPAVFGQAQNTGPNYSQRQTQNEGGNNGPLQGAQLEAELAKLRAVSGQVPQRQLTGFNMQGATPDVASFTGAQRQAFLPNNSQGDPAGDADAEARRRMLAAASFRNFQGETASRGQGY